MCNNETTNYSSFRSNFRTAAEQINHAKNKSIIFLGLSRESNPNITFYLQRQTSNKNTGLHRLRYRSCLQIKIHPKSLALCSKNCRKLVLLQKTCAYFLKYSLQKFSPEILNVNYIAYFCRETT